MTDRVRIIKHEAVRGVDPSRSATRMIGPVCISIGMNPRLNPRETISMRSQVRRAVERNSAEISAPRQRRDQLGTGLRGVRVEFIILFVNNAHEALLGKKFRFENLDFAR